MTDESTDTDAPRSYTVFGWASLGPSFQVQIDSDKCADDIPYDEQIEGLRDALRSRGFTDEQIEQMAIEVDQVMED